MMFALLMVLATMPPGEIFGDVRLGDQYVAEVPVKLTCGTEVAEATTDKSGSYRIHSKSGGKCSVSVTYKGSTAAVEVVVFERPTRYRLVLEEKEGKYTLKRV